jgi:hypothetical protein
MTNNDFWSRLVIFTDKDGSLNKAHAKHLEARLCAIGSALKRCDLRNVVLPKLPNLSGSDRDLAERFLGEMLVVLPTIGVTAFQRSDPGPALGALEMKLEGVDANGFGFETSEGFVVSAGSRAKASEAPSIHGRTRDLRASLLENGVLEAEADSLVLTQDYVFSSPSEAAAVLLGRSVNGREKWIAKDGRSLKQLQEEAELAGS